MFEIFIELVHSSAQTFNSTLQVVIHWNYILYAKSILFRLGDIPLSTRPSTPLSHDQTNPLFHKAVQYKAGGRGIKVRAMFMLAIGIGYDRLVHSVSAVLVN